MGAVEAEGMNIAATEEAVQGASPPPATNWLNLEADAIGDPGADYQKTARAPFTIARQLRRPFISGMNCALTLDVDAIKDHIDFFGEAIFKAKWKHSGGKGQSLYRPTAVTATGYTVPALGNYGAGFLFYGRGFGKDENNGLKVSLLSADVNEIKLGGTVVEAAPPANATLEVCGYQFAAGDLELDADGNFTCTDDDFTTKGFYVDQVVYIPSQAEATAMGSANYAFSNADYCGFFQIVAIAAKKLTVRRRGWVPGAATNEAASTVRMFFTKWIRNVARRHADEKRVSHAFEVTYPELGAGGVDAFEYLLGYMLDQVTFDIPAEGKVSMQMTFIGKTASDPGTARAAGPANALNVVTSLALSTSTDFLRLSVDNVDESGLMTDFQNLKVVLRNNIGAEKAVGHLGNRFTPLGTFQATTQSEVYFTDPDVVAAVRDCRILRLMAGMRNDDFGVVIDIPSTGAMSSKKKIEHNKLVTVSSEIAGFMDSMSGFTAGMSVFAYLPKA